MIEEPVQLKLIVIVSECAMCGAINGHHVSNCITKEN